MRYLQEVYRPAFSQEFAHEAAESGSAFVPLLGMNLDDVLCEKHERSVGKDNCVQFETLRLQIPKDTHRMNYVKTQVRVHRYANGQLAVFHGLRRLARYDAKGQPIPDKSICC